MQSRRQFVNAILAGAGAMAGGLNNSVYAAEETTTAPSSLNPSTGHIPIYGEYDVVVCGGGPAGTAAALSARRAGLSVLLVEAQGQLGGIGVSGLVSEWLGGDNGGIFHEFSKETEERGISRQSDWGPAFDPFAMAAYLDEKILSDKVDLLLDTRCVNVRMSGDRIRHVAIFNKSGFQAVVARAIVDATGDADIATLSGCKVVKGRDEDGLMTPTSLMFHVYGVDESKLQGAFKEHGDRLLKFIEQLREKGEWPFAYDRFITRKLNDDGVWMINTIRLVGFDGTNGGDVTRALIQGRKEAQQLMTIFRKHIPGYENARIKAVAGMLGVRETRRIVAEYEMTIDDLARWGRDRSLFNDVIGYSTWSFDLPDPHRPSHNPGPGRKGLPKAKPVPYGVMVPRPIRNLICPGRAISVERHMLGALRVMSPSMAMGQAAGLAAKQVVRQGKSFSEIDLKQLLGELVEAGVNLEAKATAAKK